MKIFLLVSSCLLIASSIIFGSHPATAILPPGCSDNASCTHLCGFAGTGECIDGKYCKCETCPGRSLYELTSLPKLCTLDPTCLCPAPTFSLRSGKFYSGHRCFHNMQLICICFCMPTSPGALLDVLKCPFPKTNGTTTTTIAPSTSETSTN